jgi:hypothetical protein
LGKEGIYLLIVIMDITLFDALFGSRVRARMLRLFLLNPEDEFDATAAAKKVLLKRPEVVKELNRLEKMKFIQAKRKQNKKVYQVRLDFPFFNELRALVSKLNLNTRSDVFRKLRQAGNVKLVLITGVFINYPKSKVDMLLVIDNASKLKLRHTLQALEAEVGKEVRYSLMTSEEMRYRMDMLDRFLIEFFEGPYESVIDKMPDVKRFVAGR